MTTKNLGLTTEQAIANQKMGNNLITQREPKNWRMLLKKFITENWYIMLLVCEILIIILSLAEKDYVGTFITSIVALVMDGTILLTERKSDRESVEKISFENEPYKVTVFRDNSIIELFHTEIVCGDCVLLNVTDTIPADGIIIEGEVMVDQHRFTSYEEPVRKIVSSIPIPETYRGKLDSESFCLRGSTVVSGSAVLLVTEVGNNTVLGWFLLN